MRRTLALAAVLVASRVLAGPIGADDPHAASATGFPGVFLGSVELSLEADPRYGSRLLDALDEHLQAVGVMTGPQEVSDYLEQSAGGSEGVESLRAALGRESLDTTKAAALLLADALARPEQFREVLQGLESMKRGVGRHAAALLRDARGTGDKNLLAALHAAGSLKRADESLPHIADGWFSILFDAESTDGRDGVVLDAPAEAAPDAGSEAVRPRASDLSRAARP
jgi:hypothetical protein